MCPAQLVRKLRTNWKPRQHWFCKFVVPILAIKYVHKSETRLSDRIFQTVSGICATMRCIITTSEASCFTFSKSEAACIRIGRCETGCFRFEYSSIICLINNRLQGCRFGKLIMSPCFISVILFLWLIQLSFGQGFIT